MVVDFNYTTVGLQVTFTNLSSQVPDGYSYLWDFGDGSTSEELNPVHIYEQPDFYRVTLSILNQAHIKVADRSQSIGVTDKVKTHLSNTIYILIDTYIPKSIFGYVPIEIKRQFIEKWQLYIQPLVNHCIPIEQYSNELYYEALENQLIMELAAYDFMVLQISNMVKATSNVITENNSYSPEELNDMTCAAKGGTGNYTPSQYSSGSSSSRSSRGGNSVKVIKTGPTEVEFNDEFEQESDSVKNALSAMKPGGLIDILRQELCMLAGRLDIYLPICDQIPNVIVPKVVNRRRPGFLDGPDPFEVVKK